MTYKLKEDDWKVIEEIAEKLTILPEGESLVVRDTRSAIDKLRYVIYSWLFETGRKQEFKLIRKNIESLEIKRKAILRPKEVISSKIEEFVSQNIEVENEQEFQELVRNAIQCGKFTASEGITAMSEWNRVQGRT